LWKIGKTVKKGEYVYAVVPDHPRAIKFGYILVHRVVMENHLGRLLDSGEIVHHVNGDKKNNDISNLEVMSKREHARRHALAVGRAMVELRCPWCGKIFAVRRGQSFLAKGYEYTCCSRRCRGRFSRMIQLTGRTQEVEDAISGNLVREFRSYDDPEETHGRGDP
jgi:hypothetical protein